MTPLWVVTPEKIDAAIKRIAEIAQPKRVVLFGSCARGETRIGSDLDVLVITNDDVASARAESVRIRRALRDISMPMDILVIQEGRLSEVADAPGLIYREILRTGKVVYDTAA